MNIPLSEVDTVCLIILFFWLSNMACQSLPPLTVIGGFTVPLYYFHLDWIVLFNSCHAAATDRSLLWSNGVSPSDVPLYLHTIGRQVSSFWAMSTHINHNLTIRRSVLRSALCSLYIAAELQTNTLDCLLPLSDFSYLWFCTLIWLISLSHCSHICNSGFSSSVCSYNIPAIAGSVLWLA